MSTISVPLNKEAEAKLDELVKSGVGSSRADVMRKGLLQLSENRAVELVLESQREATVGKLLQGDLRKLIKKFS